MKLHLIIFLLTASSLFGQTVIRGTRLELGSSTADAGAIRLANAALIGWEASPDGTDVTFGVTAAERFAMSAGLDVTGTVIATTFSGAGTSLTGTAAGLTAGSVTTIPNLTGHITSTGNATVLNAFTLAQLNTAVSDANIARIDAAQTFSGTQTFDGTILNLGGGAAAMALRFLEPSGGGPSYFSLIAPALAGNVALTWPNIAPAAGEVLGDSDGNGILDWITPAGSGDVSAAAVIADNTIVVGDGGAKGVKGTDWSIDATTGAMSLSGSEAALGGLLLVTNAGAAGGAVYGSGNGLFGVSGVDDGGGTGVLGTNATVDGVGVWGSSSAAGGTGIIAEANHATATAFRIRNNGNFDAIFSFAGTADRAFVWPNQAGTVALTSDITAPDIDALSAATEADIATTDVFLVSDAGTEKKITLENLVDLLETQPFTFSSVDVTTLTATNFEIGVGATDTTLTRVSAGVAAIEGAQIALRSGGNIFTGTQVFPSGQALIAPALGTIASGVGTALTALDDDEVAFDDTGANWTATAIGPALEELDDVINGGVPNDATGKVDWSQLTNVPAGFADGTDASAGAPTWDTIGDAAGDGSVAFADTTQDILGNTNDVTGIAQDMLRLTLTNDAGTDVLAQRVLTLRNASATGGTTEALLALENLDNSTVTAGITVAGTSTGAITTAIDVSDAEIGTALAIGSNDTTVGGVTVSSTEFGRLDGTAGALYSAGGTDVAVADGGTGLSSGTSGGVLAYTASGTLVSSGALAANAIVIGGGAGVAPSTTTTGTGVLTAAGIAVNTAGGFKTHGSEVDTFIIAASDETTALTTGTAKVTFRAPYACTVTGVRISTTTANTGGTLLTVDINESGTTIISTKLTCDASEKTSTTAATPAVISDSAIADDAEITIDIDAVGNTIAGAGLKVYITHTH